jgi:hypothetical protein
MGSAPDPGISGSGWPHRHRPRQAEQCCLSVSRLVRRWGALPGRGEAPPAPWAARRTAQSDLPKSNAIWSPAAELAVTGRDRKLPPAPIERHGSAFEMVER